MKSVGGSVSSRVHMFEHSGSRKSTGSSASKRLAIVAQQRSKRFSSPLRDSRDDASSNTKPTGERKQTIVEWPADDHSMASGSGSMQVLVDPEQQNGVRLAGTMTSDTVAETCTFDSIGQDDLSKSAASVAWPDEQSEAALHTSSTLSSNSARGKMSNRLNKIRSQQEAKIPSNERMTSRLSKIKANVHRRTPSVSSLAAKSSEDDSTACTGGGFSLKAAPSHLSAKSLAAKPSEDESSANTSIVLKQSLEDASVVMEEERASSVATSTSSLSCDELTTIAKRALQAAREKEGLDKSSHSLTSTSRQARLARTKYVKSATRRRFEKSLGDDNSVMSTESSKCLQSLDKYPKKADFDDSTLESFDDTYGDRESAKSKPGPPVKTIDTIVTNKGAPPLLPRRSLLKVAAASAKSQQIDVNSTKLNLQDSNSNAADADDDSTIGSRSVKSGPTTNIVQAPSQDDNTIGSSSSGRRNRLNAFEKAKKRREEYLELTHQKSNGDGTLESKGSLESEASGMTKQLNSVLDAKRGGTLESKGSVDSDVTGMTKELNAVLDSKPRSTRLSQSGPAKTSTPRTSISPSRLGRLSSHPALRSRVPQRPNTPTTNHGAKKGGSVCDDQSVDPFDAARSSEDDDGDSVWMMQRNVVKISVNDKVISMGRSEESNSTGPLGKSSESTSTGRSAESIARRKPIDAESTFSADPFEEARKLDPDGDKPPTPSDTSNRLRMPSYGHTKADAVPSAAVLSNSMGAGAEDHSVASTLSRSSEETSLPSHIFRSQSSGSHASNKKTKSSAGQSIATTVVPEHQTINFTESDGKFSDVSGLAGLNIDSRDPPITHYQSDCSTMVYSQRTDNDSAILGGKYVGMSSSDVNSSPSGAAEVPGASLLGELGNQSHDSNEPTLEDETLFTTDPETIPNNGKAESNVATANDALAWWAQKYAEDQDDTVNKIVTKALTPTSKTMASNAFDELESCGDTDSKGDDESLFSGLDNLSVLKKESIHFQANDGSKVPLKAHGTKEGHGSDSPKPYPIQQPAPPPPPPRRDPTGQVLIESKLVHTVNSDITSSVVGELAAKEHGFSMRKPSLDIGKAGKNSHDQAAIVKEMVVSPPLSKASKTSNRRSDNSQEIEPLIEQQISSTSGSGTDDDGTNIHLQVSDENDTSSAFVKFSNSVLDSFASMCRIPGIVEPVVPSAQPSFTSEPTSQTALPDLAERLSSNNSTVSGSSQSTMNDKEVKKWDDWDRRDTISTMKKDAETSESDGEDDIMLRVKTKHTLRSPRSSAQSSSRSSPRSSTRSSSRSSPRSSSRSPKVRANSRHEESRSSMDDDKNTAKQLSKAKDSRQQKPPRPLSLSINQRRILEKFTQNLEKHSVEVLKQNRDTKWQVRYLTVCKERQQIKNVKLNYKHTEGNDCPVAILWLKRFVAGKDYSTSLIDKQGRGGVVFADLVKVTATGRSEPVHPLPKKYQERYRESVTVIIEYLLNGYVRSMALRCKTTDEAHFLCTGLRVTMDIMKRERMAHE